MLTEAINNTGYSETQFTFSGMTYNTFSLKEANEAFQYFLKREFANGNNTSTGDISINHKKIALGLCLVFQDQHQFEQIALDLDEDVAPFIGEYN